MAAIAPPQRDQHIGSLSAVCTNATTCRRCRHLRHRHRRADAPGSGCRGWRPQVVEPIRRNTGRRSGRRELSVAKKRALRWSVISVPPVFCHRLIPCGFKVMPAKTLLVQPSGAIGAVRAQQRLKVTGGNKMSMRRQVLKSAVALPAGPLPSDLRAGARPRRQACRRGASAISVRARQWR